MNYNSPYYVSPEEERRMRAQQQAQAVRGGPSPGMAMQFIPQGGGAAGGASGASGGASGGGAMAGMAWPAALAAAIIANETYGNKEGRRPDDFGDHMTDLVSGKVLEYDADALADSEIVDKIPGASGLTKLGGKLGNPEGLYELGESGLKKLKFWEWF